jgi:hypothetical protein
MPDVIARVCPIAHWRGVQNDTDAARDAAYDRCMISTLLIVLLVLWVLGMASSYTLGGLIHVLLLIAIVVVLLRVINGQNPIRG